ncbi:unnamed protein product, partial [Polarella glacialis]
MTKLPSFLSSMFPGSASNAGSSGAKEPDHTTGSGAGHTVLPPARRADPQGDTSPSKAAGRGDSSIQKGAGGGSAASSKSGESPLFAEGMMTQVTKSVLQDSMEKVAASVQPWLADDVIMHNMLQEAVRNHGQVDLMQWKKGSDAGVKFACKRMPTRWVREGPDEFLEQYPSASERPWFDLGLVRHLNRIKFPYVCDLLGIFRDEENSYVASSLATEGDLFSWCDQDPKPGKAREEVMNPIVSQIFSGVRLLHDLGIAHRDLSLENILLTKTPSGLKIRLIDFGMSTLSRFVRREIRGKQSYQAPEMHSEPQYDTFLADAFSVGVVVFAMAVQDYPWTSTKRNSCQLFEYVVTFGFMKFLKKRKLRKGTGEHLSEVFSPALAELLEGLLEADSAKRLTLGEVCFMKGEQGQAKRAVWDMPWSKDSNKGRGPVSESI